MGSRFKSRASSGVGVLQAQLSRRAPTDATADEVGPGARPARPRTTSRYRELSPERNDDDEDAPPLASERSPLLPSTPVRGDQRPRGLSYVEDAIEARRPKIRKLGTFEGVGVPCLMNIVGIILFLRFGFLLGQAGLLGTFALLGAAYVIAGLAWTSLSAIATNGRVHGGGVYYLVSRTQGTEMGGATGLIFLLSQALNAVMNVLGAVEAVVDIFGQSKSTGPTDWAVLPEGRQWLFLYASVVLAACTGVCLIGSRLFNRATNIIAYVARALDWLRLKEFSILMLVSLLSIPTSIAFRSPFIVESATRPIHYTGPSLHTLRENLFPNFTSHAKGSALPPGVRDGWQSCFGVSFPAVAGMMAGLSMSSSLRKPSRSIPKGTFWALSATAALYVVVLVAMASSVTRHTLTRDLGVLQDISVAPTLIVMGVLASTIFSALLGLFSCAKVLQAIARDQLLPPLEIFGQGTEGNDDPTHAVLATWVFAQLALLVDNINDVATLVTQATLLVFGSVNLACFVLRVSSSPNFRPSFRLFNEWTALAGMVTAFGAMLFTDLSSAGLAFFALLSLLIILHYTAPSKPFGDVTQALIYHQVRKYLLRLDERKAHIKFWRPQVLLLTANPRHDWPLIITANSLKKGGLLILGHVLKGRFMDRLGDLKRQHLAWLRLVDVTHVKAFVDMSIASDEREGARQILLNAGLGGMRPNTVMLGFPDRLTMRSAKTSSLHRDANKSDVTIQAVAPSDQIVDVIGELPTDAERPEESIAAQAFVGIVEDVVALGKAVAICHDFVHLRLPSAAAASTASAKVPATSVIDLWPLLPSSAEGWATYTLILLLGTTLSSAPSWKGHRLRVNTFVTDRAAIAEETAKMTALLGNLRVRAELRVFALSGGQLSTYETIVRGEQRSDVRVEQSLGGDGWWEALKSLRRHARRRERGHSNDPTPGSGSRPQSPRPGSSSRSSSVDGSATPASKLQKLAAGLTAPSEATNLRLGVPTRGISSKKLKRSRTLDVHIGSPDSSSSSSSDDDDDDASSDDDAAARLRARRRASLSRLPDEPRMRMRRGSVDGPTVPHRRHGSESSVARPTLSLARPNVGGDIVEEEDRHGADDALSTTPKASSRFGRSGAAMSHRSSHQPPPPTPPPMDDSGLFNKRSSLDLTLPTLSFDDLPLRAQLVILNELMSSQSDDATLLFTSLPPPERGSADSYERSSAYLQSLRCLLAGLPPSVAVSSREQVMTMAL